MCADGSGFALPALPRKPHVDAAARAAPARVSLGGPASAGPLDLARAAALRPRPGLRTRLEMAGERHRRGNPSRGMG
jgi:hypothetical protein